MLEAVELVVTELITNAVLHGTAPLGMVVAALPGEEHRVRVEVSDGSRVLPVRPLPSTEGMTGRGLALVVLGCTVAFIGGLLARRRAPG